ncbi:MAG: transposase [Actinomycetota bacterium]|nr:transposase [Actinomycetota bacterium]
MDNLTGEAEKGGLRVDFDACLRLELRGAKVTTDAVLLAVRELDEVLGLAGMAGVMIQDGRTGRNIDHELVGLLRQSVYVRPVGYENVNVQERLFRDPAMRAVIGKKALERNVASSPTVSRFETEILTREENLEALANINHAWASKANNLLAEEIEHLTVRLVGRPSMKPKVYFHNFTYRAKSWRNSRRVVAKIESHQGEFLPRTGFIVTNLRKKPEKVVRFYNKRGNWGIQHK